MLAIDHHPGNRQPQEHPGAGIVMMMAKNQRKEDGRRDLQGKVQDQRRMRRGRRRPLGTNYGSLEHWAKLSEKAPNGRHNLLPNMNTPNPRMLGFGLQPAKISLTPTHANGKTRRTELYTPYPSWKNLKFQLLP